MPWVGLHQLAALFVLSVLSMLSLVQAIQKEQLNWKIACRSLVSLGRGVRDSRVKNPRVLTRSPVQRPVPSEGTASAT
jgi:hypothetical protein